MLFLREPIFCESWAQYFGLIFGALFSFIGFFNVIWDPLFKNSGKFVILRYVNLLLAGCSITVISLWNEILSMSAVVKCVGYIIWSLTVICTLANVVIAAYEHRLRCSKR